MASEKKEHIILNFGDPYEVYSAVKIFFSFAIFVIRKGRRSG